MKKLLLALAVIGFVAAPAFANESSKSSASAPAPAAKSAPAAASATTGSTGNAAAMGNASNTTPTATTTAKVELPAGVKKATGSSGEYFTTASGQTIYTYAKDEAGKASTCTGACAKTWTVISASSSDKPVGSFSVISGQWAFNGKPLYTYSLDKKPGDMNGASIPGWSVASASPIAPVEKPSH